MNKITSNRRVARLIRNHYRQTESAMDDAITQHYGVSGMVADIQEEALRRKIRRETPYTMDDAHRIADEYFEEQRRKRLQHKNPIRLKWLKKQSEGRYYEMMMSHYEIEDDGEHELYPAASGEE